MGPNLVVGRTLIKNFKKKVRPKCANGPVTNLAHLFRLQHLKDREGQHGELARSEAN